MCLKTNSPQTSSNDFLLLFYNLICILQICGLHFPTANFTSLFYNVGLKSHRKTNTVIAAVILFSIKQQMMTVRYKLQRSSSKQEVSVCSETSHKETWVGGNISALSQSSFCSLGNDWKCFNFAWVQRRSWKIGGRHGHLTWTPQTISGAIGRR